MGSICRLRIAMDLHDRTSVVLQTGISYVLK